LGHTHARHLKPFLFGFDNSRQYVRLIKMLHIVFAYWRNSRPPTRQLRELPQLLELPRGRSAVDGMLGRTDGFLPGGGATGNNGGGGIEQYNIAARPLLSA